jgi:hypothetical protein
MYPHKAMSYARQHLQGLALGPVTLTSVAQLLETLVYSLLPREAHSVVQSLLGLNTELCQAGPVGKPHPANQLRLAGQSRPGNPAKRRRAMQA